jgi:hypothetical protein
VPPAGIGGRQANTVVPVCVLEEDVLEDDEDLLDAEEVFGGGPPASQVPVIVLPSGVANEQLAPEALPEQAWIASGGGPGGRPEPFPDGGGGALVFDEDCACAAGV